MTIAEQYSQSARTEVEVRKNAIQAKDLLSSLAEELNTILGDNDTTKRKFSVVTEDYFPKSKNKTISIVMAGNSELQRLLTITPSYTNKYGVDKGSFFTERSKSDHSHHQKILNVESLLCPIQHYTLAQLSTLVERTLMLSLSADEQQAVVSYIADGVEDTAANEFAEREEAIAVVSAQLATQGM